MQGGGGPLEPSPPTAFPPGADAEGYVVVAQRAELPPGTLKAVAYGEKPVVLANCGGEVYALADVCIHAGAALSEGTIRERGIVCPWHAWTYDAATGEVTLPRATGLRLARYPVRIDGDAIAIGPRPPRALSD